MLYRILLLLVAVGVWLGFHFTGAETHATDGIIFFGLIIGEGLLIALQSRTPKAPGSLNSFALLALLSLPDWHWLVVALLLAALACAVIYLVLSAIAWWLAPRR